MADTIDTDVMIFQAKDEASSTLTSLSAHLEGLHGQISLIKDIAIGSILGTLGLEAGSALGSLAKGLVSTNADIQTLQTSLRGLYGSATEANAALDYMTNLSLAFSLNREDVLAAGQTIAGYGQDITKVLPALGNVAAYMGVDLPSATNALEQAMTGRFQSLTRTLHVTKAELESFGMTLTPKGAVDPTSLLTAFEALSAAKFGQGMADQAKTLHGEMNELHDQFVLLEEDLGKPIFGMIESGLSMLLNLIRNNGAQIAVFGVAIGAAFGFIGGIIGTFVANLENTLLPVVQVVIGTMATWWDTHANQVKAALAVVIADFGLFVGYMQQQAKNMATAFEGTFGIAWGLLSIVFGTGLALLTGNWDNFEKDFNDGCAKIQEGFINLTAGLMSGIATLATNLIGVGATMMLPVAEGLLSPWTQLARGIRDVFAGIAPLVGTIAAGIGVAINAVMAGVVQTVNGVIVLVDGAMNLASGSINGLIDKANGAFSKMPGWLGGTEHINKVSFGDITQLSAPSMGSYGDMNKVVQDAMKGVGINQNQSITAGVSQSQAATNLAATQKAILDPMLASLEASRKALLHEYGLDSTGSGSNTAAQAKGKGILDQIDTMIQNLLKSAKNSSSAGQPSLASITPAGGLPAPNWMTDPATAAAVLAASIKAATVSGASGAVNPGALSASFGSTLAQEQGSSPAARTANNSDKQLAAVQQQLTLKTQELAQAQQQITLLTAINSGISQTAAALRLLVQGVGHAIAPPDSIRMAGARRTS